MAWHVTAMAAITKAQLAQHLGIKESDLTSRSEAARIISEGSKPVGEGSLRVRPMEWPGFWNLADTARGGEVVYSRPALLAFKAWRDGGPTPDGYISGRQPNPDPADIKPVPKPYDAVAVARLISVYKARSLYTRFQDVSNPEFVGTKAYEDKYLIYHKVLGTLKKTPNPREAVKIDPASGWLERHLAWVFSQTSALKDADPTHPSTKLMLYDALREIVTTHSNWRIVGDMRDAPTTYPPKWP